MFGVFSVLPFHMPGWQRAVSELVCLENRGEKSLNFVRTKCCCSAGHSDLLKYRSSLKIVFVVKEEKSKRYTKWRNWMGWDLSGSWFFLSSFSIELHIGNVEKLTNGVDGDRSPHKRYLNVSGSVADGSPATLKLISLGAGGFWDFYCISFLVPVSNPCKSSLRKGLLWLIARSSIVDHSYEGMVVGVWWQLMLLHLQLGSRERGMLALTASFLVIPSRVSIHGVVPTTFTDSLPTMMN